jgi:hypothetical protein
LLLKLCNTCCCWPLLQLYLNLLQLCFPLLQELLQAALLLIALGG